MVDRLRAIEVFVRVVETGSFTAAARSLGLPKASATTLIQGLEASLQIKLLHRTTRQVSPTSEGMLYYEETSRLIKELAELESDLLQASVSPRGAIRVDVPAAAGRHVLAPALPTFYERYPEITIQIGSTDRPLNLLDEGIDCVIRGGDLHDESLAARKLGELPVVNCAAPAYLSRYGAPEGLEDLSVHKFIAFFSPKTGRIFDVDFARGDEQHVRTPRYQVAANDTDTWVALAVAGLGILQAPCGPQVRAHIEQGHLKLVMPEFRCDPLPLHVLHPISRKLPARVRVFLDWLIGIYAEECRSASTFAENQRNHAQADNR